MLWGYNRDAERSQFLCQLYMWSVSAGGPMPSPDQPLSLTLSPVDVPRLVVVKGLPVDECAVYSVPVAVLVGLVIGPLVIAISIRDGVA